MKEEQKAKKAAYDKKYMKDNVVRKLLAFNLTNEQDMAIIARINSQPNATEYIKRLVLEDMHKG